MVKVSLKFRQEKEEVRREGGREGWYDALSTSSSLIVCIVRFASRSPWEPAEKPIDSPFGLLWKRRTLSRILWPLLSPFLSSSLSPGSLSSRSLSARGFSFLFISPDFRPPKKWGRGEKNRKKWKRRNEGEQEGEENAPLKEVYFANKTGLVLCLLKQ